MRAVLQRVSSARVTVAGETTGEIGPGLLVLLGVQAGDTEDDARWLAGKLAALRLFEDAAGKMNRSLVEAGPAASDGAPAPTMLVVSQFTLLASTRQGARPSFSAAAPPEAARLLYDCFVRQAGTALGRPVATGRFGARMDVSLVNDGPVTLVVDSRLRE